MRVLTSVNGPYLRLLELWLKQAESSFGQSPIVCCMDDEAFAWCSSDARVHAVREPETASAEIDRHAFWYRRFAFLKDQLHGGDTIVHSDLDAFWLENPLPVLAEFQDDLVFSREYGIPHNICDAWGFTLCCGFFAARPTVATHAFFERWDKVIPELLSDQIAVNALLFDLGAEWRPVDLEGLTAHRALIEIDGEALSVLVLPDELVCRELPFDAGDALVAHPFFERPFFASYLDLLEQWIGRDSTLPELPADTQAALPDEVKKRDIDAYRALLWSAERNSMSADNWAHKASLDARMGLVDSSTESANRALAGGVEEEGSLVALATALLSAGRRDDAVRVLRPLCARGTSDPALARQAAQLLLSAKAPLSAVRLAIRMARLLGLRRSMKVFAGWIGNLRAGAA